MLIVLWFWTLSWQETSARLQGFLSFLHPHNCPHLSVLSHSNKGCGPSTSGSETSDLPCPWDSQWELGFSLERRDSCPNYSSQALHYRSDSEPWRASHNGGGCTLCFTSSVVPALKTVCVVNQEMTISQLSLIFIRYLRIWGSIKPYHWYMLSVGHKTPSKDGWKGKGVTSVFRGQHPASSQRLSVPSSKGFGTCQCYILETA